MVSYDDATSFGTHGDSNWKSLELITFSYSIAAAKGQFIRAQELLGFAMWEAGGDYNDILLDSISKALDIPDSC